MTNPNGSWIKPALAVSAHLAELPKAEQARALAEAAELNGVKPSTMRRNLLAARYCASHGKGVGIDVGDIVAAALTIEMLMRLEKRDRAQAIGLRRAAFEGKVSALEMQERLKRLPERKTRGHRIRDWIGYAHSMIEICYKQPPASFAYAEKSDIGKLLKVDIEVWPDGETSLHAIFLSPLDVYSECTGGTIEDVLPFALAACLMYPRVNLVLHEDEEVEHVHMVFDKAGRKRPGRLKLFNLGFDKKGMCTNL